MIYGIATKKPRVIPIHAHGARVLAAVPLVQCETICTARSGRPIYRLRRIFCTHNSCHYGLSVTPCRR